MIKDQHNEIGQDATVATTDPTTAAKPAHTHASAKATQSPRHALVVDDEPDIRELLCITLERMDIAAIAVGDLTAAKEAVRSHRLDLCLTDMRLPDGDGLDLVAFIQRERPALPVAVITAHGSMETAIQALKNGAFDFVTKPVDLAALRALVQSALKLSGPQARADIAYKESERPLIGESEPIQRLRATIAKLARSQAPVYISGESGTGKELVARMIHDLGPRAGAPFVPVNCGAIPTELMESEFFGHKKGSFSGAVSDKAGLFTAASGGTLFLDEVAELPLSMQVKLLRAIQEKRIRPVGAMAEVPVDCRILSATHKDLKALVAAGEFRQDLFYRVNVIELAVPPLRERGGDLMRLVAHFLARLADALGVPVPTLDAEAKYALASHPFPGNVRELENVLERAMTLCEGGRIGLQDLNLTQAASPSGVADPPADGNEVLRSVDHAGQKTGQAGAAVSAEASTGAAAEASTKAKTEAPTKPTGKTSTETPTEASKSAITQGGGERPVTQDEGASGALQVHLEDVERERILAALEKTRWNRTRAAEQLGITFRALRYRLKKFGIEGSD